MPKVKVKKENKGNPEPTYPADHKPAMRVPKNGSCCKNCEYVNGNKCTNEYFIKWHGSNVIPAPIDEYCSDWYEPNDEPNDEKNEQ